MARQRVVVSPQEEPATPSRVAEVIVARKSLSELAEHPRNDEIRNHPEPGTEEWEALKASLDHDYFDPLVWNQRNGQLVSGHLRKKVMTEMGFAEADVVVVDYDEPTHLARLLAANKQQGITLDAGLHTFHDELASVEGFDIKLTGFTGSELAPISSEEEDEDEGMEGERPGLPPAVEQVLDGLVNPDMEVAAGEHWRAGQHHIYCVPVVDGDREWMARVTEDHLLLVRPGVYSLTYDGMRPAVCVEPDPLHASLLISNYARVFGEEEVERVSS